MSFSDFIENEVLNELFGATAYAPSGTLYVALSTSTPTDLGGNFTEPNSNDNYARDLLANDKTSFTVAATGTVYNDIAITFAQATGGSWGTVTHFAFYSHLSGTGTGDFVAWGALDTSKSIDAGDTAEFAVSGISITLD